MNWVVFVLPTTTAPSSSSFLTYAAEVSAAGYSFDQARLDSVVFAPFTSNGSESETRFPASGLFELGL